MTTTTSKYSGTDTLIVEGTNETYNVVYVVDHLEDIMKATTGALADFTKGKAVALDFSAIRARGSKTSHAGMATGAASFAKAFADLIQVMSSVDDDVRHKPIAILKEDHPDIEEYLGLSSKDVIFLVRTPNGLHDVHVEERPTPNWELSTQERADLNLERDRRASPWYEARQGN